MKKWIRFACAGAVLAGMLTASALAADFTASAEHLSELGLFRGSEQGYELDRAPTRGEAAAMLVRLLGAEDEAQAMAYTAPFTDLADWQKPYVQYLYEGRLTNGASATAFEPEGECTAQMYAAFLLRALGYTEAADTLPSYMKLPPVPTTKPLVSRNYRRYRVIRRFLSLAVVAVAYRCTAVYSSRGSLLQPGFCMRTIWIIRLLPCLLQKLSPNMPMNLLRTIHGSLRVLSWIPAGMCSAHASRLARLIRQMNG